MAAIGRYRLFFCRLSVAGTHRQLLTPRLRTRDGAHSRNPEEFRRLPGYPQLQRYVQADALSHTHRDHRAKPASDNQPDAIEHPDSIG